MVPLAVPPLIIAEGGRREKGKRDREKSLSAADY